MIKILFLILFTVKIFALEITLLNRNDRATDFSAGDLLQARLEVYPKQEIDDWKEFFKFIEKKEIGQFSIISQRGALKEKDDTISVDLDIVLREEVKDEKQFFYPYREERLTIKMKGFNYKFIGITPKVNILNLTLSEEKYYYIIIISAIVSIAMLAGVILFRRYKKHQIRKKIREQEKEIAQIFNNLDERSQLEHLYSQRNIWEGHVKDELKRKFYSVLNRYQYQEKWSVEELDEVREAAQKLELVLYD